MSLSNYRSREHGAVLGEGKHIVRLIAFMMLNSNSIIQGMKIVGEKIREWVNAGDQYAMLYGNEHGSILHRYNETPWLRWTDLSLAQQESGKYEDIGGFAVETVNGKKYRLPDVGTAENPSTRKQACTNIIENMLYGISAGAPEGADGETLVDFAIKNKTLFEIDVVRVPWEDPETQTENPQFKVKSVKRLVAETPVKIDLEA